MEKLATFTELEDALEQNVDAFITALKTCWKDTGVPACGRKFLDSYLRSIMDPSLLYRMHPASSRMGTPFYYKYGMQYFRFPRKLLEIVARHCQETFPDLWPTARSFETSLDCFLDNYRKRRARQMRAYIASKAMSEPHPMFFAIAWDTWKNLGVFQSPAPIWSRHTAMDRDAYFTAHLDAWNAAAETNNLEAWSTTLPSRWDPEGLQTFGPPPETVNESYWPYP